MKLSLIFSTLIITLGIGYNCFAPVVSNSNQAITNSYNMLITNLKSSTSIDQLEQNLGKITQWLDSTAPKLSTQDKNSYFKGLYTVLTSHIGQMLNNFPGRDKQTLAKKSNILKTIDTLVNSVQPVSPKPASSSTSNALTATACVSQCGKYGRFITTLGSVKIARDANTCIPACYKAGHPNATIALINEAVKQKVTLSHEAATIAQKIKQ
jgi:hypothetical protein